MCVVEKEWKKIEGKTSGNLRFDIIIIKCCSKGREEKRKKKLVSIERHHGFSPRGLAAERCYNRNYPPWPFRRYQLKMEGGIYCIYLFI